MKEPRTPVLLLACQKDWEDESNLQSYHDLVAALDDQNPQIRRIAESLLHRSSPRPERDTAQARIGPTH